MLIQLSCFILTLTGLLFLTEINIKSAPPYLRKAVRLRGDKIKTSSEVAISKLAEKISRLINIDPIKRERMDRDLKTAGYHVSPEMFLATSLATALIYSIAGLSIVPLSPIIGICVCGVLFWGTYSKETKKLKKELSQRRDAIERELPQFAGTIRQNLNTTRDIVSILEGYRKVCGTVLLSEIDKTLNDIKTGNAEKALKAFEARVNSTKVSELVRGLIGLLRGDDQRMYFEMLTADYIKAQNEAVKRELLGRPDKLKPNVVLLLLCMLLMFITAIGGYMSNQIGNLI